GSIGYSEVFLENKRKMELLKDRWEKEKAKPFPLLNGYEIMAYLCIPPGKRVGVLKESLYEAQLKGIIRTKNEAIAYLKAIAKV
ncbi:MAG: Poly A polymerase, putative, partial [bacterium 42_11]